jgi:hypothetical protein
MEQQNPNSIWPVVLAIVITAVVVGGGMYWWLTTTTTIQAPTTEIVDTTPVVEPEPEPVVEPEPVTTTIEQGYSYESPQWETFTSDVESKTGEVVKSFYMPKSPSDKDMIFVSTSGDTTGEWPDTIKITNKIYSYNIQTSELSKLYEEHENRLLRTMGIEGTKLIVMYDGIDNSPGPCFSIWADWDDFGYLDTENPNKLRSYTVPAYQVQKGKDEQEECEAEMGF